MSAEPLITAEGWSPPGGYRFAFFTTNAEVQELLRGDPRVSTIRPGERYEGGTGVTVVEFA